MSKRKKDIKKNRIRPLKITAEFNDKVYRQPNKIANVSKGYTLLIEAILNKDNIKVKRLLVSGADPSMTCNNERSPLHHASLIGNIEAIDMLVNAGANINPVDNSNKSPIFDAMNSAEPLKTIKTLIKHKIDPNIADDKGSLPLHLATQRPNEEIIILLAEHTKNIDSPDSSETTPLNYAVNYGSIDIIKEFIKKGASPFKYDKEHNTILHTAIRHKDDKLMKYMLSTPAISLVNAVNLRQETPLHLAVKNNNMNAVKELIAAGADVNKLNANKLSPLYLSIFENNMDIFNLLIKSGANLGMEPQQNTNAPLMLAISKSNKEMIKSLLNHGADVNASSINGDFPLLMAAYKADTATVKLLLKEGAKLNQKSSNTDKTALHMACNHYRKEIIELLLNEEEIDINPKDRSGHTPLHILVNNYVNSYYNQNYITTIDMLLKKGADPLILDNNQNNPYDTAHIYDKTGLTKTFNEHLLKKGIRYKSTKSKYGSSRRYGRGFDYY